MQRARLSVAAIAATVAAALALVPFFAVARMATALYETPPDLRSVRTFALVAAGALALRYVAVAVAGWVAHVAAFHVLHAIRVALAKKLGAVPLSFFGSRGAGALKKTIMGDVQQIEVFVAHHFPDAVAAAVVPVATGAALFVVDWRMALGSLAMAPLAALTMFVAMRNTGAAHAEWAEIQARVNVAMLEYLRGIHVIKTFGLAAERFGELARAIREGVAWTDGFMRTNGRGYGAFGALIGSSLVVLVPLGGHLYAQGSLSLESLVLFLVLGPQLLLSLMRLMFAWGNVERIQAGNARIQAILEADELTEPHDEPAIEHHGVAFRDVSFRYEDVRRDALVDVSFEALAGKVTAIVGPSGAGKTTLLRLVPRLFDATRGAVTIGGVDVRAQRLDTLLARISMVFQDVFLFQGTIRENLRLARSSATDEEIEAACRAARAHDFIATLPKGLDTVLGERGARLSGGEKQRLSIARALLKDAPILLLDEATAFADPENEARISEALATLTVGRTVVVVAHRLSTIAAADHIVVLDAGRVLDQGTHETLLGRGGLYAELWRSHEAALDWSMGEEEVA